MSLTYPGSPYSYKSNRDFLIALCDEENCYYGGSETVGFAAGSEGPVKIYHDESVKGKNNG